MVERRGPSMFDPAAVTETDTEADTPFNIVRRSLHGRPRPVPDPPAGWFALTSIDRLSNPSTSVVPRDIDRTLAFDIPRHLGDGLNIDGTPMRRNKKLRVARGPQRKRRFKRNFLRNLPVLRAA